MDQITLLAVGPALQVVSDSVAELRHCVDVHYAETMGEASDAITLGLAPMLIVVMERWPGDVPESELWHMQALAPLARIWRIAGPWCEGEMRTAPPVPGMLHCYSHQIQARLADEILRLINRQPARATVPPTATDEERALALVSYPSRSPGFIVVLATEREAGLALLDACQACGFAGTWVQDPRGTVLNGAIALLCDLRPHELDDPQLPRRIAAVGNVPTLAVTGFVRPEDAEKAKGIGFTAVISKPLELPDLAWHLNRIC